MARLTRFYHLDPERIFTLPVWIIEALHFWMEPLRAEETQAAALAASLPWLQPYERRRITRTWQKAIARAKREEVETRPVIAEDVDKAKAWFKQQGVKVND